VVILQIKSASSGGGGVSSRGGLRGPRSASSAGASVRSRAAAAQRAHDGGAPHAPRHILAHKVAPYACSVWHRPYTGPRRVAHEAREQPCPAMPKPPVTLMANPTTPVRAGGTKQKANIYDSGDSMNTSLNPTQRTHHQEGKPERLNFRTRPELRAQLERAAQIRGLTLSEFALSALSQAAEDTIRRHEVITIGDADRETFLRVLADQSPLPPAWDADTELEAQIEVR
jgi:uncharacterized protein (DUF1778 family)